MMKAQTPKRFNFAILNSCFDAFLAKNASYNTPNTDDTTFNHDVMIYPHDKLVPRNLLQTPYAATPSCSPSCFPTMAFKFLYTPPGDLLVFKSPLQVGLRPHSQYNCMLEQAELAKFRALRLWHSAIAF
jgi:hypothetical protein